jgi:serine protease Do
MPFRYFVLVALGGLATCGVEAQPRQVFPAGNAPAIGYLGVGCQDINADQAKELRLPEEAGAVVTSLAPTSPAATAGLRLGDVIVLYNSQRVEGQAQLYRLISETPPGREVRIQVFRNTYPVYLVAKIGAKPREAAQVPVLQLPPSAVGTMPDMPVSRMSWRNGLGTEWEAVDGQLASSFGVKDGGVLVRSVMAGSPAERGGLRAGDVIVRIGDARVTTPPDVSGRIRAVREQTASVTVVRDKKELTLAIPLDGSRAGQ